MEEVTVKILGRLVFLYLTAMLVGCTTATSVQDPIYLKMIDMEARLIRMERVIDNQSLIELATSVDQLRAETQALRGDIETMAFQTEGDAGRQRELYVDVDTRIQQLEELQTQILNLQSSATEVSTSPLQRSAGSSPNLVGSEQENYQQAFDLLRDGSYGESADAFSQFLAVFSSSPLAGNAQYWLAETYYVQREFSAALPVFQMVVDRYPESAKLPDALLKVGYCNYELGQFGEAENVLQRVARDFPATTAARLATQRLEAMIQEQG
jgi:tol-pal system protein YbgF